MSRDLDTYHRGKSEGYVAGLEAGVRLGFEQAGRLFEHQLILMGDRDYHAPELAISDRCPADDEPCVRPGGNGVRHA